MTIDIKKSLVNGSIWIGLAAIANGFLTISLNGTLTRLLSPEDAGKYFLAASFAMVLSVVMQLGMNRSVVRLITISLARKDNKIAESFIKSALFICFLFSACALGLTVFLIPRLDDYISQSFDWLLVSPVIFIIWCIALAFRSLIAESFRGLHKIGLATLFGGFLTSLISLLLLLILLVNYDSISLSNVIKTISIASALTCLAALLLLHKVTNGRLIHARLVVKDTFFSSVPLLSITAGFLLMRESHLWITGTVAGATEAAYIGAVIFLIQFITVPLKLTNSLIQPSVAHFIEKNESQKLATILRGTAFIVTILSSIGFAILIAFGEEILSVIYGKYYIDAYFALLIVSFGQLVNIATGSPGVVLTMAGYNKQTMYFSVVSISLGILITYIFSVNYGHVAAALGIAISIATHNVIMWWFCKSRLNILTHGNYLECFSIIRLARKYHG